MHLQAALANTDNASFVGQVGSKLRRQVESWVEQRLFPGYALGALDTAQASTSAQSLGEKIRAEIATQWPVAAPNITGFSKLPPGATVTTAHFTAVISNTTGGLSSLQPRRFFDELEVQNWASRTGSYDLFQFVYRSLSQKDFGPFRKEVHCSLSGFCISVYLPLCLHHSIFPSFHLNTS